MRTKTKWQKITASLLAASIAVSVMPGLLNNEIVLADGFEKTQDNTCLGTSGISSPEDPDILDMWTGSYVYFGTYDNKPLKYRVLSPNTNTFGEPTLYLDCDSVISISTFDNDAPYENIWDNSQIKTYLNGDFYTYSFNSLEKAAIAKSYVSGGGYDTSLTGEYVFLLDIKDVSNIYYGYWNSNKMCHKKKYQGYNYGWWLRSACDNPLNQASFITLFGDVRENPGSDVDKTLGVSPALNVKQSSILFSTIVNNGSFNTYGAEYKLTLLDPAMSIKITSGQNASINGSAVKVPYQLSGPNAGNADVVSYMILDKEYGTDGAKILYYGYTGGLWETNAVFTLPSALDPSDWGTAYYVYIIAEDLNGTAANGYAETDFASAPVKVDIPSAYPISVNVKSLSVDGYEQMLPELGGTVTVVSSATPGETVTVNAVANSGYKVQSIQWGDGGVSYDISSTKSFTMPNYNVAIDVVFRQVSSDTYDIAVNCGDNGTISVPTYASSGDTVTVTATPDSKYIVDKITWTPEGGTATDITYTGSFVMPAKNVTIDASFKERKVIVNISTFDENDNLLSEDGGTASVDKEVVAPGDIVKVTAAPYEGYELTDIVWGNGVTPGTDITATKEFTVPEYVPVVDVFYKKLPSYAVSFNTNGGSAVAQQTVYKNSKATKPSDPTKSGYTFGGWYTNSACTTAYSFDTAVTADITLYAKWTAVSTPTPAPATPGPTATTTPAPTPVATSTPAPVETPKLTSGIAHVQDIGDVSVVVDSDGVLTIGTTGMGKRLEQITINFENNTPYSGTLEYRVHVQDIGWMDWVEAGEKCGTEGMFKRIEAIEIRLTGELADYYSVEYCVHIQDYGDMQGWVKDGALAGTTGESKRIEELKIKIVPVNSGASMSVKYRVHVQDYGWEKSYASNGAMSGTSGESKRLEGIEIFLEGNQYSGGVKFKTHVQDYGWQGWSYDGEMSGTQGESKRLEGICIELYGEVADYYDIYYRVHAQDIGWMGWAKNGECAGTAGRSARLEGIQIVLVPKGSPAPGATYEGITAVTDMAFVEGF